MRVLAHCAGCLAAGFAAAALAGCGNSATGADDNPSAPAVAEVELAAPIAAAEIARRDLSRRFSSSATVEPYSRVRLASRTSGNIAEVAVEAGDAVTEGQVLARIDTAEEAAELARIEAEVERARRNYERSARLHANQLLSSTEYERVRLELQVAQRRGELWRSRIEYGEVRAPIDAVVTPAARRARRGRAGAGRAVRAGCC